MKYDVYYRINAIDGDKTSLKIAQYGSKEGYPFFESRMESGEFAAMINYAISDDPINQGPQIHLSVRPGTSDGFILIHYPDPKAETFVELFVFKGGKSKIERLIRIREKLRRMKIMQQGISFMTIDTPREAAKLNQSL